MFGENRHLQGLPEDLRTERQPGRVFNPNEGLKLDWVNRYKTINFGVNAQLASSTVLQDNQLRCYLLIQNQHATADLLLSFTTDASAFGSIIIVPRGNYELTGGEAGGSFVPSGSVNILGTVADQPVTIIEGTLSPYPMNL